MNLHRRTLFLTALALADAIRGRWTGTHLIST